MGKIQTNGNKVSDGQPKARARSYQCSLKTKTRRKQEKTSVIKTWWIHRLLCLFFQIAQPFSSINEHIRISYSRHSSPHVCHLYHLWPMPSSQSLSFWGSLAVHFLFLDAPHGPCNRRTSRDHGLYSHVCTDLKNPFGCFKLTILTILCMRKKDENCWFELFDVRMTDTSYSSLLFQHRRNSKTSS